MAIWDNIEPRFDLSGDKEEAAKFSHYGRELLRQLQVSQSQTFLKIESNRKELPGGGWINVTNNNNLPKIEIYMPPPPPEEEEEEGEDELIQEFLYIRIGDTMETSIFVIWDIKNETPLVLKDADNNDIEMPCPYSEFVQAWYDSTQSFGTPLYTSTNMRDATSPWGDQLNSTTFNRDMSSDCRIGWDFAGSWPQTEVYNYSDSYSALNVIVPYTESWEWTNTMDRDYTKTAIICYTGSQEGDGVTSMSYEMSALASRADITQWAGWSDLVVGTTREYGFLGTGKLTNATETSYFGSIIARDEEYADYHEYEHIEWDCLILYPSPYYGCAWYRSGAMNGRGDGNMIVTIHTPLGESVLYTWKVYEPSAENYLETTYWHYDECYGVTRPEAIVLTQGYKQTHGIMLERETLITPTYAGEVTLTSEIPALPKYGTYFRVPISRLTPLVDSDPNQACTGARFLPGDWVMGDDVGWNIYDAVPEVVAPLTATPIARSSQCLGRKDLITENSRISVYLYFGISYLEVVNHDLSTAAIGYYTRRYYQDTFAHAQAVDLENNPNPAYERTTELETLIKQAGLDYFAARNTYRAHPAYQAGGSQEASALTYDQTYIVEAPLRIGGDVTIQIRGVETTYPTV